MYNNIQTDDLKNYFHECPLSTKLFYPFLDKFNNITIDDTNLIGDDHIVEKLLEEPSKVTDKQLRIRDILLEITTISIYISNFNDRISYIRKNPLDKQYLNDYIINTKTEYIKLFFKIFYNKNIKMVKSYIKLSYYYTLRKYLMIKLKLNGWK